MPRTLTVRAAPAGARQDLHVIAFAQPPGRQRPGHDRAESLDREDAIQRQPQRSVGGARGASPMPAARSRRAAPAARRRSSPSRRRSPPIRARPAQQRAHVVGRPAPATRRRPGRASSARPRRAARRAARRCPGARASAASALVGGDHQHAPRRCRSRPRPSRARSARGRARRPPPACRPPAVVEVREAELDGDAARLLDGQPIGVDAGQRAHERGLAVVDVPRGSRDDAQRRALRGRHARMLVDAIPVGWRFSERLDAAQDLLDLVARGRIGRGECQVLFQRRHGGRAGAARAFGVAELEIEVRRPDRVRGNLGRRLA